MVAAFLLIMSVSTTTLACPDRGPLFEQTHELILNAQYAHAEKEMRTIKDSFRCGSPPLQQELAHYWFIQGIWYQQTGESERAHDYLNQALLDGFWDKRYGIESWEPRPPSGTGFLLSDQIKHGSLWLNQQPAPAHTPTRVGPNLAQWIDSSGQVLDGAVFWSPSSSVHYLTPVNSRWSALQFRNAAKWSAVSTTAFTSLALFQNYRMNQAQNTDELKQRFGVQVAFGSLSLISLGVSSGFYLQYLLY
jgi:hypothetical protein